MKHAHRQLAHLLFAALLALVIAPSAQAEILFSNAERNGLNGEGLITGPRPGGGSFSELQPPNTSIGFSADGTFRAVGDDFTISNADVVVDHIDFYVLVNDASSQITNGYIQLIQGNVTGPLLTTGSFVSSTFTDIYRIHSGNPNLTFQVRKVRFNFNGYRLPPGSYFLAMQFTGNFPSVPPLTKVGQATLPGANGLQFNFLTGTWGPAQDVGGQQEFPFEIHGWYVDDVPQRLLTRGQSGVYRYISKDNATTLETLNWVIPGVRLLSYCPANQSTYGITSSNTLIEIDLEGNTTLIASNPEFVNIVSLAYMPASDDYLAFLAQQPGSPFRRLDHRTGTLTNAWPNFPIATGSYFALAPSVSNISFLVPSTTTSAYLANFSNSSYISISSPGFRQTVTHDPDPASPAIYHTGAFSLRKQSLIFSGYGSDVSVGNMVEPIRTQTLINEQRLPPRTLNVISGIPFGGNLLSLRNSDDDYFYVLCDETEPNGEVEWEAHHAAFLTQFYHVRVESASSREDISQFVEQWDWTSNAWVTLNTSTLELTDKVIVSHVSVNADRFVNANHVTRGRIRWIPQADLEASDGWLIQIDRIRSEKGRP